MPPLKRISCSNLSEHELGHAKGPPPYWGGPLLFLKVFRSHVQVSELSKTAELLHLGLLTCAAGGGAVGLQKHLRLRLAVKRLQSRLLFDAIQMRNRAQDQ